MSRQATFEYVGQQRRIYCAAKNWKKRKAILTNFCEVAGYNRKYANKLLTGNRRFRLHPGRGRTYGQKALELAETLWKKTGCVCPQYLVARMDRHPADFKESPMCRRNARRNSGKSASPRSRAISGGKRGRSPAHSAGLTQASRETRPLISWRSVRVNWIWPPQRSRGRSRSTRSRFAAATCPGTSSGF